MIGVNRLFVVARRNVRRSAAFERRDPALDRGDRRFYLAESV
jgi:hypothetical protein